MNPLSWAKETAKQYREQKMTTSKMARVLEEGFPEDGFDDPGTRFWFFNTLARDTQRSWKTPGIRSSGRARTYTPPKLLNVDDYRDVLRSCQEDIAKYEAKGRKYLTAAVEAGHTQLRLEFPEFNSESP